MKRLLLVALAACSTADPGTSVRLALSYESSLGLDTADVTLADRTETTAIAHELLILLPESVVGAALPIEVWGRVGNHQAAHGTSSAVPVAGETVTASLTLDACAPRCEGDTVMGCGEPQTCVLGCTDTGTARCIGPTPSNGVDPALADGVVGTKVIKLDTTIDADTGRISGGVDRPAGAHVLAGVGYERVMNGGVELAVFAFHNLTIDATATVSIVGTHPVVLLIGDTAQIAGVIDVSGGRGDRATAGPGGGLGGIEGRDAAGPGAGGSGQTGSKGDGGGGGGGGGEGGADGGAGNDSTVAGGAAGERCFGLVTVAGKLEPLRGGGGGGRGSRGGAATGAAGGGGGGALQITALGAFTLTGTGTIDAGGAGGDAGPTSAANNGAGGGGGAGGAVLIEAPKVSVASTAIIVANGGGGGGGGGPSATAGQRGRRDGELADGGAGGVTGGGGGTGAAQMTGSDVGQAGGIDGDGGGGGGSFGGIVIRGRIRDVGGVISPQPVLADIKQ